MLLSNGKILSTLNTHAHVTPLLKIHKAGVYLLKNGEKRKKRRRRKKTRPRIFQFPVSSSIFLLFYRLFTWMKGCTMLSHVLSSLIKIILQFFFLLLFLNSSISLQSILQISMYIHIYLQGTLTKSLHISFIANLI